MPPKKTSGKTLTTKDWLKFRHYKQFSSYDVYYINLANFVFDYLGKPGGWFRERFDRQLLKEVSIIAASYFEDFVNDIGLWPALIRKHEELFGWALPFYDLSDYDKDYLNPQEIHHPSGIQNEPGQGNGGFHLRQLAG